MEETLLQARLNEVGIEPVSGAFEIGPAGGTVILAASILLVLVALAVSLRQYLRSRDREDL